MKVDRVWEASGYATRQAHAFVTVKNITGSTQYVNFRAVLCDGDGVCQERNQYYRASGEPAALFNATPAVQPGQELKIRYVFNPDSGSQPIKFTLHQADKRAEFAVQVTE